MKKIILVILFILCITGVSQSQWFESGGTEWNMDSVWAYLDTTRIAFFDKDGTFAGTMTFTDSAIVVNLKATYLYATLGTILDLVVSDSLTAVSIDASGNITGDSVHCKKLILDGATEWIFGTGGTDRWVIDATGHLSPILDGTYDIGLTDYRVKMIYTDSLTVTENIITKNLEVTGTVTGNTTIRDTNSFDNQLEADTVTVTGAEATDLYWIQTMGQVVLAADFCVVEPTATGFIVRRSASGTANLRYAWWRVK